MYRCVTLLFAVVLVGCFLAPPSQAAVSLTPEDISWETIGTQVRFQLTFHSDAAGSDEIIVILRPAEFGAFVDPLAEIGTATIPPIPPDSFFDVFFDVELSALPPSAREIVPGDQGVSAPGLPETPNPCPPDNFWNGNVDVIWSGPGGTGQVNAHFGTIFTCPGAIPSYIHVITDCQDPGGISWSFSGLCPGFTATLVVDDGLGNPNGPAPNPIPPGVFDGWICVSAGPSVPVGTTCCFNLDMTCAGVAAQITVCSEACDWGATPTEPITWGKVKTIYGVEE